MTTTDLLLLIIAGLLAAQLVQRRQQHRELVAWLDGLGDMTGDLLRGILENIRKGGTP